jgi:hypothetical protein
MTGILQGALGGGRALLVGWILPSLINVLIFAFVLAPGLDELRLDGRTAVVVLVATAVLGLVLAALQTPLYRILEGYLLWPERLVQAARRRHLAEKHLLQNRLDAVALVAREQAGTLTDAERAALAEFRAHPVTSHYVDRDFRKGAVWIALLDERLHRYPVDDRQVAATRLGNAIRRFEEYGFNRFRLDSQALWHELNAAAGESARKQTDDARMSVDFFISLLYGHLLVAGAFAVSLVFGAVSRAWLVIPVVLLLLALSALWYRLAVVATDEWAGAVRALVNLGRVPLATSLGLALPDKLDQERAMWRLVSELVSDKYHAGLSALDPYRAPPELLARAFTPVHDGQGAPSTESN